MKPKKFRKRPVVIEALQWTGSNGKEMKEFIGDRIKTMHLSAYGSDQPHESSYVKEPELIINTLEGQHVAAVGDWIIRGVKNEAYPCKPDIFELTYEEVL